MDLVDLCQVVDIGCPTVEKECGKHATFTLHIHDKCYGGAHHQNLLRTQRKFTFKMFSEKMWKRNMNYVCSMEYLERKVWPKLLWQSCLCVMRYDQWQALL